MPDLTAEVKPAASRDHDVEQEQSAGASPIMAEISSSGIIPDLLIIGFKGRSLRAKGNPIAVEPRTY